MVSRKSTSMVKGVTGGIIRLLKRGLFPPKTSNISLLRPKPCPPQSIYPGFCRPHRATRLLPHLLSASKKVWRPNIWLQEDFLRSWSCREIFVNELLSLPPKGRWGEYFFLNCSNQDCYLNREKFGAGSNNILTLSQATEYEKRCSIGQVGRTVT